MSSEATATSCKSSVGGARTSEQTIAHACLHRSSRATTGRVWNVVQMYLHDRFPDFSSPATIGTMLWAPAMPKARLRAMGQPPMTLTLRKPSLRFVLRRHNRELLVQGSLCLEHLCTSAIPIRLGTLCAFQLLLTMVHKALDRRLGYLVIALACSVRDCDRYSIRFLKWHWM